MQAHSNTASNMQAHSNTARNMQAHRPKPVGAIPRQAQADLVRNVFVVVKFLEKVDYGLH